MSSTIDNRVVEMDFDNRKFEANVQTSIKSLKDLKNGLNLSDSAKSLNTLSDAARSFSLAGIADGVSAVSDRFSALGIVGMTVLQNLTTAAINMGKQMVNTVAMAPMRQGFSEYETQMNAIQTVLANTQSKGTTLDQVNEALNQLNIYSDKTIYNFTEMARNIGTFTAAGVSLETSTAAIKGIANLAAVSGSNSQQASVAMYQLSQALSSGTVRLMDWNSVVNAGMGGQVFQDALKETARIHGIAIDDMVKREGSFRETLQKGWLTSEILTETLSKFTGDLTASQLKTMGYTDDQITGILKLGETANNAATKVKTFSQLTQTLMEALQSGWGRTWQIIIGDFEEAKKFMTEVSDTLGVLIGDSADARNSMLKTWKAMGGRTDLIQALRNAFVAFQSILKPISDGITSVIKPLSGYQIYKFTAALKELTEKFKMGDESAKKLKATFRGIASLFSIIGMALEPLVKGFWKLASILLPKLGGSFLDAGENVGNFLTRLRKTIEINNTFNKTFDKMIKFIIRVKDAFSKFGTIISEEFKKVKESLSGVFKDVDTSGLTSFVDKIKARFGSISKIGEAVNVIFEGIGNIIKRIAPVFTKVINFVGKMYSKLGDVIFGSLEKVDYNVLFDGINAGLLAALIGSITSFIKSGKGVFDGISGILDSVKGALQGWQESLKASTLLKIASAIAILAAAIVVLSLVDSEKMTMALAAMTASFTELFASMAVYEKISGGGKKGMVSASASMIAISLAINILSSAVSKLANIDTDKIKQGLLSLELLLGSVLAFSLILSKNSTGVLKGTSGLILFSAGIAVLSAVVKKLGEMDVDTIKQGLLSIGIIFAEIAIFMKAVSGGKNILGAALSLVIISSSLLIFADAVRKMGELPLNQIINGLIAMAAVFTVIVAAVNLMPKNMIATAVSLYIISSALTLLSSALVVMGGMTWDEIARGLVVLAGAMVILGVAMYAMSGALPGAAAMLIMAGAIAILTPALKSLGGMSMEEIGKSLLMLVGVFAVLGIAALVLAPLVPVLLALGAAMFLLGVGAAAIGVGVLAFSLGLAALAASGVAGAAVLSLVVIKLLELIPLIVKKMGEAITLFLGELIASIPLVLTLVGTFLLGLVELIINIIPKVVEAILFLITSLLQSIAENLPAIIQAGYDILLAFLTGISNNIGGVVETAIQIVLNFINAIANKIPDIVQSGWDLIISFVDGLTAAVEENMPRLMESVTKLGIAVVEGFANGIKNSFHLAFDAVNELGEKVLDKLKGILDSHSPSKETEKLGSFFVEGFALGVSKSSMNAYEAVKELGNTAISGLSTSIKKISDMVSNEIDLSPTIRPVVDLSDVMSSKKQLSGLFSGKTLNLGFASSKVAAVSSNISSPSEIQNGSLVGSNRGTTVSLTQINNSPVALSRVEIYRQTRNQLITLKGLVNNA